MATAKKHSREYTVTLELCAAEAEVLFFVMRNIGGSPDNTPRAQTQAISAALSSAGVEETRYKTDERADEIRFL